jgi:hypothetical protein
MDTCLRRDDGKMHTNSAAYITHLNAFQAFAGRCVGGQGGAQLRIAVVPVLPDLRDSACDLGV